MDKGLTTFMVKVANQCLTTVAKYQRKTNKRKETFLFSLKNSYSQCSRGRAFRYPTVHTRDLKGERFPPLEIPPYIPKYEYANAHAHARGYVFSRARTRTNTHTQK